MGDVASNPPSANLELDFTDASIAVQVSLDAASMTNVQQALDKLPGIPQLPPSEIQLALGLAMKADQSPKQLSSINRGHTHRPVGPSAAAWWRIRQD
jgi:hypothetical protein